MENIKIEDLKKELYTGDFGDCICDYDDGYICDIITEIADNHIDIYWADLFDWAKGNVSYIEDALNEFGTPNDFIKIIQQGQFYAFEQELYENIEDSLKLYAYVYIENVLGIESITEEQNDRLLDYDYTDSNDTLENIIEYIKEVFETEDSED